VQARYSALPAGVVGVTEGRSREPRAVRRSRAHQLAAEALELDHRDWIHDHHRMAERTAEEAFDRLNPGFGVPADRSHPIGHRDVAQREAALALGIRVAVHDSRQNDRNPVIWQAGQDYRAADAIHAARTPSTRTRHGPERVGPKR
jgi:hypothetical protein